MIIQGHHPSHDMNQPCISKVERLAAAKASHSVFSVIPLTGKSWVLMAYSWTQTPSRLWFHPSLSPRVLSTQPEHGKEKKRSLRGFYEPDLEAAPAIFLICHRTEPRHVTTSGCKGNVVQLHPKDYVRAQRVADLCHRLLADFIENHIIKTKPFLLLRKSLHSKKWPIKEQIHFLFILQ